MSPHPHKPPSAASPAQPFTLRPLPTPRSPTRPPACAQRTQQVGFKLAGERVILVSRPDAARTVLADRPDLFVKAGTAFFPVRSLPGGPSPPSLPPPSPTRHTGLGAANDAPPPPLTGAPPPTAPTSSPQNSSLAGEGLLVSDGDVWRRQRRLSNPAFRRAAVEGYGAAMSAGAEGLVRGALGRGRDVDVFKARVGGATPLARGIPSSACCPGSSPLL